MTDFTHQDKSSPAANDSRRGVRSDNLEQEVKRFREVVAMLREQIGNVVVGQSDVVEHLLITLWAGGHCLVTGMPGTAKTLLVKTLADALGLSFNRIQFTPDLMPTDVTGTDIVDEGEDGHRHWRFIHGPLFTQVLLADEINRTPPKTQAALLEAMQEYRVTVRGTEHEIGKPFFVLATQNPLELEGTYPLPEAQLDRFIFNVHLDYLPREMELEVVERYTAEIIPETPTACTSAEEILAFQQLVRRVPVADSIKALAVDLVRATRPEDDSATDEVKKYIRYGASARAILFITLAAKARALMQGRVHVERADVLALARPVLRHRVMANYLAEADGLTIDKLLDNLVLQFDR